jgi:hypothetical protein
MHSKLFLVHTVRDGSVNRLIYLSYIIICFRDLINMGTGPARFAELI